MITVHASTELLRIGSFAVQTWGAFVALGILIAIAFILREAKKKKLTDKIETLLLFIIVFGLIGGRMAYILVNPGQFQSIISFFELWKGGLISFGVLLGVILGAFAFKLTNKIKSGEFSAILDLMAPWLILAIAIGRIGCFLRGCCFGLPTTLPWGVAYVGENSLAEQNLILHPTQIYHLIADLIIFFIILKLYNKKQFLQSKNKKSKYPFFNKNGTLFLMFLILYSVERFFIDFLRYHPINEYAFGFSITQIVFLAIFIISFVLLKTKEIDKK